MQAFCSKSLRSRSVELRDLFENACRREMHVLPVVVESVHLGQLGVEVHEMASEKEIVLWSDCHGITHERGRVDCESCCEVP